MLPAEIRAALDDVSAPPFGYPGRLTAALEPSLAAGRWCMNGAAMAEWEYQHLYLPRGISRGAAHGCSRTTRSTATGSCSGCVCSPTAAGG